MLKKQKIYLMALACVAGTVMFSCQKEELGVVKDEIEEVDIFGEGTSPLGKVSLKKTKATGRIVRKHNKFNNNKYRLVSSNLGRATYGQYKFLNEELAETMQAIQPNRDAVNVFESQEDATNRFAFLNKTAQPNQIKAGNVCLTGVCNFFVTNPSKTKVRIITYGDGKDPRIASKKKWTKLPGTVTVYKPNTGKKDMKYSAGSVSITTGFETEWSIKGTADLGLDFLIFKFPEIKFEAEANTKFWGSKKQTIPFDVLTIPPGHVAKFEIAVGTITATDTWRASYDFAGSVYAKYSAKNPPHGRSIHSQLASKYFYEFTNPRAFYNITVVTDSEKTYAVNQSISKLSSKQLKDLKNGKLGPRILRNGEKAKDRIFRNCNCK